MFGKLGLLFVNITSRHSRLQMPITVVVLSSVAVDTTR
jgi:hypothetical protein